MRSCGSAGVIATRHEPLAVAAVICVAAASQRFVSLTYANVMGRRAWASRMVRPAVWTSRSFRSSVPEPARPAASVRTSPAKSAAPAS